ncbi:T9SS type A sorting domain-containing protein [Hymenobacter guriensis]|uniref:T9SS type A sorting domain-containing protein n=1 Tax=Hymenobacter guriensis TaxID=2793065 RepID=A0ABS0KYW4_9BACT|nr:T9SS type A sorting domain-containing protein [Hymenobacter guriensis]MBG8553040.1 T9SS type A sorting domain-containing protein [Hymenobacter guriensis]
MKKTLLTHSPSGLSRHAWRALLGLSLTATLGATPALAVTTPTTISKPLVGIEEDRVITGDEQILTDETYHDLTIAAGATLELYGKLTITGTMTVEAGGTLNCAGFQGGLVKGPGAFVLADEATLVIRSTEGIAATGQNSGIIQTAARSFSSKAAYVYLVPPFFILDTPPVTGTGLPAEVAILIIGPDISSISARQQKPADSPFAILLSQDVKVRTGVLVASADLYLDDHQLTLLSTKDGTAEILPANLFADLEGEVIGNTVVAQKYIDAATLIGYHHLSSPVQDAPFKALESGGNFKAIFNSAYNSAEKPGGISPFPNVFGYDESRLATPNESYGQTFSRGWFSPTESSMEEGRGYSVNIRRGQTLKFAGAVNNGPVGPLTLTRGDEEDSGWNLLGNPYPSSIDWYAADVLGVIPGGMERSAYIYSPTSQYGGTYRTYFNNGDGTSFGDPMIAPGQGFFTRLFNDNSSVELTFTNEIRGGFNPEPTELQAGLPKLTQRTTAKRTTSPTQPYVHLELKTTSGVTDPTYVYFQAKATAAVDNNYDAPKLRNVGTASLYTMVGTKELAVNGQAPLTGLAVSIPVGVSAGAGTYILRAEKILNFAGAQPVSLVDNVTGKTTDLRQQPEYTFTLDKAFSGHRFNLVFGASSVTGTRDKVQSAQVALYPNPARTSFELQIPVITGGKTVKATLYNQLGQRVQTRSLPMTSQGAQGSFDVRGMARGIYSLQLEIGTTLLTKRVVLE